MPAMEGDSDRPFARLFLKADDLFGFIWHMEGLHGIAILRRTIADAALLQASQRQITAAANIGLATRQQASASTGQANEIYSFRREVFALGRKRC
jgi:hypothetical protein